MGFSIASSGSGSFTASPSPRKLAGKKVKEASTPVLPQRDGRGAVGTQLHLCSRRAALLLTGISASSLLQRGGESATAEELAIQGQSHLNQEQVSQLVADAGLELPQPTRENTQRLKRRARFRSSADRGSSTGRGRQRARESSRVEEQVRQKKDGVTPQPQEMLQPNPSDKPPWETKPSPLEPQQHMLETKPSTDPQQQQLEIKPSNQLLETVPSSQTQLETKPSSTELLETLPSSGDAPDVLIIKEARKNNDQANPFGALLNGVGILGTAVFGALYVITHKDKEAAESTAKSMQTLLDDKEAARISLEQNFEKSMLQEKEQHNKEVIKLKEGQADLTKQLASANSTITALGRELQAEKRSLNDLTEQLDQLQSRLTEAAKDKKRLDNELSAKMGEVGTLENKLSLLRMDVTEKEKSLEALRVAVLNKESECEVLNSAVEKTKLDYETTCSVLDQLKTELTKMREELNTKTSLVNEMNGNIDSLLVERDELYKRASALEEEYNALKTASAKNDESNSRQLAEKEEKTKDLEKKLTLAEADVQDKQALASALTKERDDIRAVLDEAIKSKRDLEDKLTDVEGRLQASNLDASELSDQLEYTKIKCAELELQVSRIQEESSKQQTDLVHSIENAKSASQQLSDELAVVKKQLDEAEKQIATKSEDLKSALEAQENLRNELSEYRQKVDDAENELNKERTTIAELNKKLEVSNDEIKQCAETTKALEAELNKVTESLSEVNSNVASLSREGQAASSRVSSLETENEEMRNTLAQKAAAMKEAQESVEDAQDLITRLSVEAKKLEQRNKLLEQQLGSAKGEILTMRRQRNLQNASAEGPNGVEVATAPVATKKVARRRKAGPAEPTV